MDDKADIEFRMQLLLRQIKDLPALPDVAVRVMRAADDSKSSITDVAKAISADQALTARVLRLANSSFYGAIRTISTVSDAVVMLGLKTVRNLALAASCQDILSGETAGYRMGRGELWRHSICCAITAQNLSKRIKYPVAEEAFVAGLLHDVGKVLISLHMRSQFNAVLHTVVKKRIPFVDAERMIIGFDHSEIGARMLEKWNLPESLVQAVRYHHNPLGTNPIRPLSCLIHISDLICMMLGIGLGADGMLYSLDPRVMDILKITDQDIEYTMAEVSVLVDDAVKMGT